MDDAAAYRVLRSVWMGDVRAPDDLVADTPRAALLKGMAAFLIAALTGEKEAAANAVQALRESARVCKVAETPETWRGWAASWVYAPEPQEATAARAITELMLASAYGMNNEYLSAPLALRRSLGLVGTLPRDGALAPVRDFGAGLFSLMLAMLPRPVARLLTLTGGVDEAELFGPEGPSEALGEALLKQASEPSSNGQSYDLGARWLALIVLLLYRSIRVDKHQQSAAAGAAAGAAEGAAEGPKKSAIDADLDALDSALPDSLVFSWLVGTVLRRLGRLDEARARMEDVSLKAEALKLGVPLYRVTFNRAQCAFATLHYTAATDVLAPLIAPASTYTAKAMALMHTAAALAATGKATEAREALQQVEAVAKASGGRLDGQLAQRAQVWLARSDSDLPLAAIEMHYSVGYIKGQGADPKLIAAFASHVEEILSSSRASTQLEPRLVASLIDGYLHASPVRGDKYDTAAAVRCLTTASESARTSDEYAQCADRWVEPFASLELANVHMARGELDEARDALERARALPQRHFSFHSWHQSAVREANRRLKEARSGKGAAAANGGGGGGEEEEEEESEEMASLRARVEQQALKEAQAEEAEEAQRA